MQRGPGLGTSDLGQAGDIQSQEPGVEVPPPCRLPLMLLNKVSPGCPQGSGEILLRDNSAALQLCLRTEMPLQLP